MKADTILFGVLVVAILFFMAFGIFRCSGAEVVEQQPRSCKAELVTSETGSAWRETFTDETGHKFTFNQGSKMTLDQAMSDCKRWLKNKRPKQRTGK